MAFKGVARLSAVQRILVVHILVIASSLGLAMIGGIYAFFAIIAVVFMTLTTTRRLLAKRDGRIIFTRSIEPLIIVLSALMYIASIESITSLSVLARSIVILIALGLQIRYFLCQFRVESPAPQSLLSLFLIVLVNTIWSILLAENLVVGWVALLIVWLLNYLIAHYWLERVGYHNSFLASLWALIAVEIMWISSFALLFFRLPYTSYSIARSALFLAVIAYAWGSMLRLHSQRKLTKRLVLEYGMICVFVLIALVLQSGL